MPGMDRQPSGPSCSSSSGKCSSGLIEVADDVVDVEGEHPQPDADLRRGQAGAALVEQRLGQVLDQLAQLLVEVDHGIGRGTQHGVAEESDRLDGHGLASLLTCSRLVNCSSLRSPECTGWQRAIVSGSGRHRRSAPRVAWPRHAELHRGVDLGIARPSRPSAFAGATRPPAAARASRRSAQRRRPSALRTPTAQQGARPVRRRPGTRSKLAPRRHRPGSSRQAASRGRRRRRRAPVRLAIRAAGGKPSSRRSASSRAANVAGSHRSSACTATQRAVGHHDDPAARSAGRARVAAAEPPAQRLLAGPQVGPGQQRPRVEQQHRAVAALGDRLRARRRHDQAPPRPAPWSSTASRPDVRTGTPGKARPSSSAVRRAPTTAARSRRPPQRRQAKSAAGRPHQRQAATACDERSSSGPGAVSASGRRVALHTGHRRAGSRAGAPARAPARPPPARRRAALPGQARQPRGDRRRVPLPVGVVAGRAPPPAPAAVRSPAERRSPAPIRSRAAAEPPRCGRRRPTRAPAPGELGPGEQHLQRVRIGRAWLGVQVVAVVPDRDEAEVARRGRTRPPACR